MGACRLAACRSAETTRATARREADGRASCASSAGAAAQRASLAGSPRNPNTSRHGCTDWCRTECVLCPAYAPWIVAVGGLHTTPAGETGTRQRPDRPICSLCPRRFTLQGEPAAVSRARSAPAARLVLSAWFGKAPYKISARATECLVRGLSPGRLAAPGSSTLSAKRHRDTTVPPGLGASICQRGRPGPAGLGT